MKAAYYDPNPVVILEHKGLYWGKLKGTEETKSIEPAKDYILPLGKANSILQASEENIEIGKISRSSTEVKNSAKGSNIQ